jgi:gliding motility-associated lipoprotein GldH
MNKTKTLQMNGWKRYRAGAKVSVILLFISLSFSCKEIDLYERLKNIPGGNWQLNEKLSYSLDIKDSTKEYYIYTTIRHTATYPYRNIWVTLGLQMPGSDSMTTQDFNIPLANNEQWLGAGMNDVYERRVRLFGNPVRFPASGTVQFTLNHIMREDPLPGILQAGIRIEPVP